MSHPTGQQYLESKVLTASQPQLHIMLLDGAIRFGRQAQTLWSEGAEYSAIDPLLEKTSDIVDELTHGAAKATGATKAISKQLEEQYAFIYRELASSRINQESKHLDTALELLGYQRETWKLACEQLERTDHQTPATTPHAAPHVAPTQAAPQSGLSLEA
jgi:flagellar protein FliS